MIKLVDITDLSQVLEVLEEVKNICSVKASTNGMKHIPIKTLSLMILEYNKLMFIQIKRKY